jgi:hypothetical protein
MTMRVEDLTVEMREAAGFAVSATSLPKGVSAVVIWGYSLTGILKLVMAKALELGAEYRGAIETAAKNGVDALVALDLPWIPESIEGTIDNATRALGYAAIDAILDALFAEQVQP